jgi:hypothetical protein
MRPEREYQGRKSGTEDDEYDEGPEIVNQYKGSLFRIKRTHDEVVGKLSKYPTRKFNDKSMVEAEITLDRSVVGLH